MIMSHDEYIATKRAREKYDRADYDKPQTEFDEDQSMFA